MIKRRELLLGSGALVLVSAAWYRAGLPGTGGLRLSLLKALHPAAGRLIELLAGAETLAPLGNAWLSSRPVESDLDSLLREIGKRIDMDAPDLAQAVAHRINADFTRGELCVVDAWQLSQTECLLAGARQLAVARKLIADSREQEANASHGKPFYTAGHVANVEAWGPRYTVENQTFNEQLDGHSALWFKIKGAPGHVKIMIDGEMAKTSVSDNVVTSGLYGPLQDRILGTPGDYEIHLVDPIGKIQQFIGVFEVRPDRQKQPSGFCPVEKWGPQRTAAGVAVNEQPDGSTGIWIRTACVPDNAQLYLGEDQLPWKRRPFGLTATAPIALFGAPGRLALRLYAPDNGEELVVGQILVE